MTPRRALFGTLVLLVSSMTLAGTPPPHAPADSLYARLGGAPKVVRLRQPGDQRRRGRPAHAAAFDKVNLQHAREMLIEQICSLSGGGCAYSGDNGRRRSRNAEFLALVEQLRSAMRAQDVPLSARNELLEILAPMKRDVVKL